MEGVCSGYFVYNPPKDDGREYTNAILAKVFGFPGVLSFGSFDDVRLVGPNAVLGYLDRNRGVRIMVEVSDPRKKGLDLGNFLESLGVEIVDGD